MSNLLVLADSIGDKLPMSEAFKQAFSGYGILGLLIAGIVLGLVAKLLIPGDQKIPFWLTIIAGILGAALGNIASALLGVKDTGGIDWIRHGLQVAGAIVVVLIVSALWAKIRGRARTS